ncbi:MULTISPECIES: hypothetical protein [unclassified Oceanobacter]|uniref:3'-5' exonuclease n=1 Tax=unclassified Oceanobacter TaxID=2620260 RepID=UPI002732BD49|nr:MULTISPECIES: hypothetical protein [unclassified Oceanobacter]MDP2607835.1 hypothetical protein [Oceanobacter sp. 1_MG-2023]MDP2610981.1 hypothetical protein [Oceanobacter sp. 2_MG-2023]
MQKLVPPIIDLEASGFGSGSYPIEVGYALEDRMVTCCLIRPAPSWCHWSEEAEKIHGISRSMLESDGLGPREVALRMNDALRGKTLYSDAWSYDSSWLGRLFDEADLVQRFRIDAINRLLSQEQMEAWHDTKNSLWDELKIERHRAANDVRVLQETFLRVTGRV